MDQKIRILVVDDEISQVEIAEVILIQAGFEVIVAYSGEDAFKKLGEQDIDLIISDVEMPDMNGLELTKKISQDVVFGKIPVILMSARRITPRDRVDGFSFGGDDYILKPYSAQELVARVKAVLRRKEIGLDANPLTHLPGNSSILKTIERKIQEKKLFSVLYADLNHFKGYNDRYGFLKGDDVIRFAANTLRSAVKEVSEGKDFLGHVGGDDFILVSIPERAEPLAQEIIFQFDKGIRPFYSEEDLKNEGISVRDRQGRPVRYPVMGISIVSVNNVDRKIGQVGEVSQIGAELKKYAKSLGKSCFVKDRRK